MFEAHFIQPIDHPALPEPIESADTRRLYHYRHQCPLHAWAAEGKRKDNTGRPHEHWFLYVEYCHRDGARTWQLIERPRRDCSLNELFEEACWLDLPEIDVTRTRGWLDGLGEI